MPSQDKKICLFGDSHLPCLRYAIDGGLVDLSGVAVEFYGAGGGFFHHLSMSTEGVLSMREKFKEHVMMVSGNARETLSAGDFDGFVFHGVRLRTSKLLVELLHRMNSDSEYVSKAVRRRAMTNWLDTRAAVAWAATFAKSAETDVVLSPAPFETQERGASYQGIWTQARRASKEQREELNSELAALLANQDITYIPQPEETIVDGCFTDDRFAGRVETAKGKVYQDTCHMNGSYGAIVLNTAINTLR